MLCQSMSWRKQHSVDRLLPMYQPPVIMKQYYAGGWHYWDKDGRPLYILRLGQIDVKGLMRSVGEEGILRHVLSVEEEALAKCEEATRVRGRPITNCTCIVDLEGLSMRHLWRPGISALLRIIQIVQANYPETMGYLLIVRAPRVFPVMWTLVSPFIDENTRNKFFIYSGKDYFGPGGLVNYIDQQYIPDFLGGECYCDVPEGGLVPKGLYLPEEELSDKEPETPFSGGGLYHVAHVMKDFPHETLIQVPERGCVITWDFDVLKGDTTFTILRLNVPLTVEPHEHHVTGAVGGVGSTQYVPKTWVVGRDLFIMERPLVCRAGDSIQGSAVTQHPGTYVLQWKFFDSSKASFELLAPHKAKVMYYTELIQSEKFRGSVSSLQSCLSGFSQLSMSTCTSGYSSQTHLSSANSGPTPLVSAVNKLTF